MKLQNIDDLYKLSPVQEALLLIDTLPAQSIYAIEGQIDYSRFRCAWEQAMSRHPALRTAFYWKGLEKPVQAVRQHLSLSFEEQDWRLLSASEQAKKLEAFVEADRRRSFELDHAPLMRLALIRLADDVHRFIWTYHRLILDRKSADMIIDEVFNGARVSAPGSFKEFISWLRQQDLAKAELFWSDTLRSCERSNLLEAVPVSTSVARNDQQMQLSDSLSAAVQSFLDEHRLSVASLLIGAWALLLCRYNDEDDAVFGVMFSGRPSSLPQLESTAGPFSNILPTYVSTLQKEYVLPWLKQINDWYLEAQQHQHAGQKDIGTWSNLPEATAFESMVAVVSGMNTVRLSEPRVELVDDFNGLDHPLVITITERLPVSLSISYDKSRFEDAFISRLLEQLKMVLETAINQPEQRLASISLLSTSERQHLTTEWQESSQDKSPEQCVHELFERQVASAPQLTALVFGEQCLTYQQLNERANQLARHLRSLGLQSETNVGVCMFRSVETVVALLAILKAGGVYIPLDPQLPSERLSFILAETNVPILLTQQHLLFDLPPIVAAAEVVCLDQEWDTIAQQSSDNASEPVSPAQVAYIIYTSGSTGRPKGVCIPHAAASSHLCAIKSIFGLNDKDRVLQFASLSFDVSIEQILAPLLTGATVVMRSGEVWNSSEFWDQVVQHRLTVLNLPPAYWNQLTSELDHEMISRAGETLRLMIVGGDLMPPEGVRRWQRSLIGKVCLLNAYGPTETTITSTVFELPAHFIADDGRLPRVPIGRGVGQRRLYVLDRKRQLVVTGGRGELYVGGLELARGYFNDPELTADRFLPDPFSSAAGARMYSTGDIVRRLPGGELEYEGRRDGQVKVRGYRIELGDVETALAADPEVHECAVALKERDGEKRLVAYVVLRPDSRVQAWELRARLKERLAEHMIPAGIVELESLPLTASGKVDRRALPDLEPDRPEQEATFAEPCNETEEKLIPMLTELLGITRIGVNDNFFEAGGDSLLATQLIARVNRNFHVSMPLRALFDQPTVAGLAQNIEVSRSQDAELPASIESGLRAHPLPLSYAQERLWFAAQLQNNPALFNIATAIRLSGELRLEPLERTFSEIIRRHETLRTVFKIADDVPTQVIFEPQPLSIPVSDLSAMSEPEQHIEVLRLIEEEIRQPFDLTRLLPLRISLLRLANIEHVLILTMHHIVSDGWSVGVMVREVAELYEAFCAGLSSPLPDLPIQYADFASWQRRWLQGRVLEEQVDYWRKELAGKLPESPLAGDHERPAMSGFAGVTRTFEISKSLSERLKELGRQEGTTLFMTLMTAFQTLLHRQSGQEDIIVGTDVANRNRTEIEGLIGFFVNLLPIRTRPSGNLSFREYLRHVKDVTLGAYAHQDLPFERLVMELQPERTLNRAPLFQTLFVMQNAPVPPTKLAGLQLSQMDIEEGVAKFDLAVFMEEKDERLIGKWNYSTEIFEASTIERLACRFSRLLESIVTNPEAKLNELEIRSETETAQEAIEFQQQQDVKLNLLRKARRQGVKPMESVIKTGYLPGCEGLPLIIEPAMNDVELVGWAGQSRAFIQTELLKHGALLFRNFNIASVDEFERFAATVCSDLFSEYGDLPREQMRHNVYGSTPYPSNQTILFHNESSHLDRWPMKILFFCLKAARSGGETPIVDCRRVYKLLSPAVRNRFAEKGIRYVRNFTEGLDVSWSHFFRITQREELEKQCDERGIEWKWQNNNELQTSKVRSAITRHPQTGEMVFFNQLQLHHASCLEPSVRESLLNTVGEERLPRNVYYRDGATIEDAVMAEVDAVYQQARVSFSWQEGDIMMLDNMLIAHGRNPYEGERKIVVALGEMRREEKAQLESK